VFKRKSLFEKWLQGAGAPHLAIVGRSGAGKTSLAHRIALYLLTTAPNSLVVLDFDGEYAELGLPLITPPFPLPKVPLAWLLSQASRPEEGGYAVAGLIDDILSVFEDSSINIDEIISNLRHNYNYNIPANVRFAALWRFRLLKKYFLVQTPSELPLGRFDLSSIVDVRERQILQQVLTSAIIYQRPVHSPDPLYLIVEEGVSGEWIKDIAILARHRGVKLIYVSQSLPPSSVQSSFETIIFTPLISTQRPQLPLPVDPSLDRGVWWVGALGVRRISLW